VCPHRTDERFVVVPGAQSIGFDTKTMNQPKSGRVIRGSAAFVLSLSLAGTAFAVPDVHSAIWRTQEIRFDYRGQLTLYECATLELRVRQLLVVLGAHPSTHVQPQHCAIVHLPNASTQIASMRIRLVSPALPSQVPAAERAAAERRRELLDRLGAATEPDGSFLAVWERIDLADVGQLDLSSGDCELLSQLSAQVVPHLAARIESRNRSCSSSPQRLSPPRLKVTALVAAGSESIGQR
jgi:hypothetical protein